ncbi:MAG: hypothetical protein CVV17_03405 [Gammaproteobacteria bacterium HGW-Gammaproteobacteria-7]|nr:MAG: hypothetical protein CVV17_03405 [Gammaproteobacteria bacterium HGW-Gammaproteobacteria-7]
MQSVQPPDALPSPVVVVPATAEPPVESNKDGPLSMPTAAGMVVAPIFEHGEGRGATGCVVVSPPVFLSEEEAMAVVREELARAGVTLTRAATTLSDVVLPQRRTQYEQTPAGEYVRKTEEIAGTGQALEVDAVDTAGRIAVEFVSEEDYFKLGGATSGSSVQSYDLKDAAIAVADKLKQSRRGLYFGVFYDPVERIVVDRTGQGGPMNWEAERAKVAKKAPEVLGRHGLRCGPFPPQTRPSLMNKAINWARGTEPWVSIFLLSGP